MATVLVIGASRGIGLELVRLYRAAGDRVIATAREDDVGNWRPPGLRRWTIAGGRVEPLDRGAS